MARLFQKSRTSESALPTCGDFLFGVMLVIAISLSCGDAVLYYVFGTMQRSTFLAGLILPAFIIAVLAGIFLCGLIRAKRAPANNTLTTDTEEHL